MKLAKAFGPLVVVSCLVAISVAKPMPRSRWNALLAKDATWTLPLVDEKEDGSADSLVVEAVEVRDVGGAKVVRLRITAVGGEDDYNFFPEQIAIGKKGVYVLDKDVKDADIVRALKKKPTFAEAGSTAEIYKRKNGTFALIPRKHPEAACYGFGADDRNCGDSPCYSWLCFDDKGVVAAGGVGSNRAFGFDFNPELDGVDP
jgi:hypothetical protein